MCSRKVPLFPRLTALALLFSLILSLPAFSAYENTHQNTGNQAADTVAVALTQMGYTDGANGEKEFTKYGNWYGIPQGYWCAMFVSWCLAQAGVPETAVKPFASCTAAMKTFQAAGQWREGPRLGGSYLPQMGDLIFYDWAGDGTSGHVGIVLYIEDNWVYSVEGNTLPNRLDQPERFFPSSESSPYMQDVVMVRRHAVDSIFIRGYAVLPYRGADLPSDVLQGFVDLQPDAKQKQEAERAVSEGWMAPMSNHTFGPLYGVTRGEYLKTLTDFFHLEATADNAQPFLDVPAGRSDCEAILAFRSLGLVSGTGGNYFHPDEYISAAAANTLLQRLCTANGAQCPNVGYWGFARGSYLQRQELAHALCVLADHRPASQVVSVNILLDGTPAVLNARNVAGANYITLSNWQALLTETSAAASSILWQESAAFVPQGWLWQTTLFPSDAGEPLAVSVLLADGVRYYKLRDLAGASGVAVSWDSAASCIAISTYSLI
ncbi:MAG: CHAP domain-containing protein [Oscillospiraceae bacterium]|nr:CHAP domain-containing protein [Oscillospiraceae bacterium]